LPSENIDESIQIVKDRKNPHGDFFNEHFVKHPYKLAKYIVYTKDKTSEQTRDEILEKIQNDSNPT
jgi:hypothetical protein